MLAAPRHILHVPRNVIQEDLLYDTLHTKVRLKGLQLPGLSLWSFSKMDTIHSCFWSLGPPLVYATFKKVVETGLVII